MLDLLPQIEEDIKTLNDDLEHKEQAAKISISRKFPVYDDDDDEYSIQTQEYLKKFYSTITPFINRENPSNSSKLGRASLALISATESDEVIKSSVENLVPIPSELEDILDKLCDMPTCDNDRVNVESDLVESLINRDTLIVYSSKIDPILEEFTGELARIAPIPPRIFEADFDPKDGTSSDDGDFEDIEYVSLEEVNDVDQEEKEFDLDDILQIQDVILREKLLNINRLITNIESLKDNPTLDRVLNSPSSFPIPVVDSDSFFEESDTSLSHLDNSLPEFETFSDHTEETRSGRLTSIVISDNSNDPLLELPEFESFHFDLDQSFPRPPPKPPDVEINLIIETDAPVIDNFNELNDDQEGGEIDFSQNVEDDDSFTFVISFFSRFSPTLRILLYFSPPGVKTLFLTPASPLRAGGISSGWNFHTDHYATISSEESHRVAVGSVAGSSPRNHASAFVSNVKSQNFQRTNQNFSTGPSRPNNLNNNRQAVMSSASSAVTYTSVYTDSEPGRAFWGADDEEISKGGIPRVIVLGYDRLPIQPEAPPSPDYIPGPEDPQTPPVPQDEDEREPMFVQAHDPDYVPEPIYPEYIPLEDEQ
ncbi:hypothetical protein Tco_1272798 [Tanacetum coccineum]